MPKINPCQHGLDGCTQCAHGYHCGPCMLQRKETKRLNAGRPGKRALREGETR